jgi:predicted DNA-binding transcriptional regulator AlpA
MARKGKLRPKRKPARLKQEPSAPQLGMTVTQFCSAYGIGRDLYYDLLKQKRGPPTMKLGRRVVISVAAAERWACEREAEAVAA